ncbi:MAG: N,N-dimethylformamidase beta subunit family domain-containing protein [Candidatus Tectimicrobiota bacterium]
MHRIEPSRLDLAREFKANPTGPHSPELQKLLKLLRWEPIAGRFVVVQPQRDGAWYLARTTGAKGSPLEIFFAHGYATLAEAHWVLFRKRWEQHTGQALLLDPEDRLDPTAHGGTLTLQAAQKPLMGYTDVFSVANGQPIAFKISAALPGRYHAEIVRLRCADHTGIGLKQEPVTTPITGEYPARVQPVYAGSYMEVGESPAWHASQLTLQAYLWPTTPSKRRHALLGTWDETRGTGYALILDETGAVAVVLGDGQQRQLISTGIPLLERHWYLVAATWDSLTGEVWVGQRPLLRYARNDTTATCQQRLALSPAVGGAFRCAAWNEQASAGPHAGGLSPGGLYNGKLEAPTVAERLLTPQERLALVEHATPATLDDAVLARWDFSRDIPSTRVMDTSPHARHGHTVNLPTRAVKGHNWDGSEYNWTHRPEHYGAIHFHDDDLYDCGWETDFTWTVPETLPSGLYCAYLTQDGHEDYIPFVVRPPRGTARASLALLLPTASYWAYANRHVEIEWRERENVVGYFATVDPTALFLHEHPELGVSMYDEHSDGSGVCYASRLRPVLNMRPKERLWQLPADTHIIDWLDAKGMSYDIITEDDLDAEGVALLASYRCVMTGTHPEYPSKRMLDAYIAYQNQGGRFLYFGGNGFYWRTTYHPDLPGVIEMRRAEDGIRSWLAEGGEYYHSFTGELGGMWRRMGRPPQSVAGTGMTAQGFDISTYFERTPDSFDPRVAFIMAGIGATERIGDFGLLGGGAAGWEIDRADRALGTPPHALVIATATHFSSVYHWVKEELTHTHSANTGETCPFVRCDMVFYEMPNGGAVFSTSSIAWAAALSHNNYDNNVSRLTENVLRRFLDPTPF